MKAKRGHGARVVDSLGGLAAGGDEGRDVLVAGAGEAEEGVVGRAREGALGEGRVAGGQEEHAHLERLDLEDAATVLCRHTARQAGR